MEITPAFDTETRAEQHLQKALNFQQIGMAASAQHELALARQFNPAIITDPRYQSFAAQGKEQQAYTERWKLPLRVGAGLLVADALILVLLGVLDIASGSANATALRWQVVHVVVDVALAINLLRLKDAARRATIWWAVIGLLIGAFNVITTGNWIDLIVQVGFAGALLVLLLSKPSKARALLAIGIFSIVYLGTLCATLFLAAISAV